MDFDKIVPREGTYCTQWDFIQDRFGEPGLLPFSVSDMDIKTSPKILEALQKRVAHGIFGYTRWNHSDYKNAIRHWYKTRFDCTIEDKWIYYSPNVIYGIVQILSIINPDHQPVCIITPCYDGFSKILASNDYKMNTVSQSINNGSYFIDWEEFELKLSRSKVFLLCNPNNPNGYLWSFEELTKITTLCKKYDVFVISDDIHMDFVYKPCTFTPITKIAENLDYLNKVVIITSSSKTFNLSGIGGAYIICPNKILQESYIEILQDQDSLSTAMTLHVTSLIEGYTGCADWVDELCEYLHKNLEFVHHYLKTDIPKISALVSPATYFSWIDCSRLCLSSTELQKALISKGRVAIMDSDRYLNDTPFLRMIVCCPRKKLEDGLSRIQKSISPLD